MELLKPYKELTSTDFNFVVRYTFYLKEEVRFGRTLLPSQHYRCDFGYAEDVDKEPTPHNDIRLYMIYPEFLDESGNPILEKEKSVNKSGLATMWILDPSFIPYHKNRIKVGTKGYFMEGACKIAECEVIEVNW